MNTRIRRSFRGGLIALWGVSLLASVAVADNAPKVVPVTLLDTLTPSAIHDVADGDVVIEGQVNQAGMMYVAIRVVTSDGHRAVFGVTAKDG